MKAALVLFLLALLPDGSSAARQSGTASLDGRVVNGITGATVAGARVRIRPVAGGIRFTTTTDAAGAFHFDGLAPGRYGLQIEHTNYVRGLGRGRSTAFQSTVTMAAGESRRDLVVRITPNSVVEGTVVTESGVPVSQCRVELLQWGFHDGTRSLEVESSGSTDARGRFRVTDVTPGTYSLKTRCAPNRIPFRPLGREDASPAAQSLGFASSSNVARITVEPGATASAVELHVRDSVLYAVTGTIAVPADARGAESIQVALLPADGEDGHPEGGIATPASPSFRIDGVAAGRYTLIAMAKAGDRPYTAQQPITLSADMPPVAVALRASVDLPGSIDVRSSAEPAPTAVSGILRPIDPILFEPRNFASNAVGAFAIHGVPAGTWRLVLTPPGADYYVQSIRLGDREMSSTRLVVSDAAPLRVVLSDGAGRIAGTVSEPDSAARPRARTIVLDPLDTPRFLNPEQLIGLAGPDGQFEIPGLAPNRYRVFILPELDADVALDPDLLRAMEAYGEIVTVTAGARTTVSGRPVPDDVVAAALADR